MFKRAPLASRSRTTATGAPPRQAANGVRRARRDVAGDWMDERHFALLALEG
jgi:hypothetical protein